MEGSLCRGDKRMHEDEKGLRHVVVQSDSDHIGFIVSFTHKTLNSVAISGGDEFPVEPIVSVVPDTTSLFERQAQGR